MNAIAGSVVSISPPARPPVSPRGAIRALRAATAPNRHRFDAGLRVAMTGAGRYAYSQDVAAMWGWLQPIETSVWSGWPAEADVPARALKSRWLEADLTAARQDGFLEGEIVRRDERFAFRSLAERMGVAFVIEDATLSARALLPRISPALYPWPARYLVGYGNDSARLWQDFVDVMERQLATDLEIDDASRAARRAFDSLDAWFRWQGVA